MCRTARGSEDLTGRPHQAGEKCGACRRLLWQSLSIGSLMANPADLERITHKLDQAYAIMAFSEGDATFGAVRLLLGQIRSDDMPNRATRALWIQIEEAMLQLGTSVVASDEVRGFGEEVHHLRDAIVRYLSRIPY